jgi:acetyl esterase/lipase
MRRRLFALTFVAVALVATGCLQHVPPSGPAPLRYRDEVFAQVQKTADIVYTSATDHAGNPVDLRLDLYQPAGDGVSRRPAVVWVHGGSFCCGSKTSPEIVDQATVFARKGYVTASIGYRLRPAGCAASAPTGECVAAIADAKADGHSAVQFLRANAATYRIDPNRIAIAGTSAGAITALNVAFGGNDGGIPGNARANAAVSLSGANVLGDIGAGEPPVLLFHGTEDRLVPYAWAQDTAESASAAGNVGLLTTWTGAGHVPYGEQRQAILDQTRNFLYAVLGLADAAR